MAVRDSRVLRQVVLVLTAVSLCLLTCGNVVYVDDDAAGADDGSSWTDAYNHLTYALREASTGDEVRVAQGTYRPNQGLVAIPEFDWRTTTFQILDGMVLKGGYAGSKAPDPNARDIRAYETILSGDLNGDDGPEFAGNEENSYHVVTVAGPAVLEGVTVTGGNASFGIPGTTDNPGSGMGGGLWITGEGVGIRDCMIEANSAVEGGGGLYGEYGDILIEDCTFERNIVGLAPPLAVGRGGGIMFREIDAVFIGCLLNRNRAAWGGAIYSSDARLVESRNCLMIANTAIEGGAVFYSEGGRARALNCTAVGNMAPEGRFLQDISFPVRGQHSPWIEVIDCILADGGNEISNSSAALTIQYTDVIGGISAISDPQNTLVWGLGNIDVDPMFVNPGSWVGVNDPNVTVEPNDPGAIWVDGDYHLASRAGRYDPDAGEWIRDDVTSPCIDAGSPGAPFKDEPAPNGYRVNMGFHGGTAEASKSEFSWSFNTTQGPILAEGLGVVLPHEHIFTDLRGPTTPGYGQADPVDVVRVMAPLLTDAHKKGVGVLLECSSIGVGRNVLIIDQVARESGLAVVVPTGVYGRATFAPPEHRNMTEDELTALFISEIQDGIEGTGIKAGFIKIATGSGTLTALEEKFLRAAGRAARQTGAAIASHTPAGANATRQANILASISLEIRFIWVHAQNESNSSLHRQLAARGVFIEFDSLGWNPGQDSTFVAAIQDLIAAGHGDRILLSHDAGWYRPGEPNGGTQKPYTYLVDTFIPKLRSAGVDDSAIRTITETNPIRAFAFRSVTVPE